MVAADLTVPEKDMRKLLAAASPEAALLYLYVNGGNDPEKADHPHPLELHRSS